MEQLSGIHRLPYAARGDHEFTATTTNTSSPGNHAQYVGTVTNLGGGKYKYTAVTGYTLNMISSYIYSGITGYTYNLITGTNYSTNYTTNYVQFAMPGVVLTNGAVLPPNGLSIATPDPAYIVGNWNVQSNVGGTSVAGSSNINYTLASGIYADAITVLSPSWNPANNTTIGFQNASTGHGERGISDGQCPLK